MMQIKGLDKSSRAPHAQCQNCGKRIVLDTFANMGFWEPDYEPDNDPEIWRHATTGYAACSTMPQFARPTEVQTDAVD